MNAEPTWVADAELAPTILAALEAEAEAHDTGASSLSWKNARPDERPRLLADAATTRRNADAQEADAIRPLTPEEAAMVTLIEAARLDRIATEHGYSEPEDRGGATLSALGTVEYVEDLIRPGRIVTVAAEEGTGKSYAITGELAIRVAAAGGSFAGTWPVLTRGPVLVLSEMHPDDDYLREAEILEALDLDRSALAGRYFRLPLFTAAGDRPALMADEWLDWITAWLRTHEALLLVVDTATGASQVDPWGKEIQSVFRRLRAVLAAYPALAVVLIVHLKKPQGRGERRLSDVLGEWGRWCDVVLLLEHDGSRTKLSTRKRIHRERRIAATKFGGLLVDPIDLEEAKGAKVPEAAVLAAIEAQPGMTYKELAAAIGVSKPTAQRYAGLLGDRITAVPSGEKQQHRLYATNSPTHSDSGTGESVNESGLNRSPTQRLTTYIGESVSESVQDDDGYGPSAMEID